MVVLSETIWRSSFGGDRALLGRRISLNGASVIVVGIMPASFRFPTPVSVIWKPFDPASSQSGVTTIFGRLKPGFPLAAAEARTAVIARQVAHFPRAYRGTPPFHLVGDSDPGDFARRALWLLLGGVALVFVVLSSNVCSLLLARLLSRRREFGVCAALGASRVRLIRQAAAEHTCIAAVGAAGGVGLAWSLTSAVPDFFVGRTLNVIDVDGRALIAACGLGVVSVLLAGLIPAWLGTRSDPADAFRGSPRGGSGTRAGLLAPRGLLVAEIGLACSLLLGSALLVRSFSNLLHADRGLNIDGVVHVDLGGLDNAFRSPEAMALGTAAIEADVTRWPEISAVALSREVPPSWATGLVHGEVGEAAADSSGIDVRADRYRVGAGFFDFYGIPIVRGRTFELGDGDQDVIVGERLARILWSGLDPLGRTFELETTGLRRRVIGVAGEISLPTLDRDLDRPEFYTPLGNTSRTLVLSLRCRRTCPDERAMRARLAAVHPTITGRVVPPSESEYLNHLRLPRAVAQAGGVFAIVAVLTAAGGLFSVMTQIVGHRRREFGIRAALGASPRHIRRLVLGDGLRVVGMGIAIGVLGGWFVARALTAFHYGVTTADPVSWGAVLATIAVASLAAAWRPALEAMRVDPVRLLREE